MQSNAAPAVISTTRVVSGRTNGIQKTQSINIDFSKHFIFYKTQQIKLCKKFLQLFVKEELFSKVLIIHCRDRKGSTEASKTCLKVFSKELPTFDRDVKIHHHCFNRGIAELRNWLMCFPRIMFGFTAILLLPDHHPQ